MDYRGRHHINIHAKKYARRVCQQASMRYRIVIHGLAQNPEEVSFETIPRDYSYFFLRFDVGISRMVDERNEISRKLGCKKYGTKRGTE